MEKYRQKNKGKRVRHFVDISWLRDVKSWNRQAKHQKHKKQVYLSSFLSPTVLHLHHFPFHLPFLFSLVLIFVLSSFLISLRSLTIIDVIVLLVCFFAILFFILSYMFFSLLSSSLFCLLSHNTRTNQKQWKQQTPQNIGTLAFWHSLVLANGFWNNYFSGFVPFFFLWFCFFDVCFVCFWFHVFLLVSKQSLCFELLLISVFFVWRFKGQVRWPEGPPHLALNPLYICCRKRIPSNLSLLEVKFGPLEGDQILRLSASTFVYSGFWPEFQCTNSVDTCFFGALEGNPTCDAPARALRSGHLL